MFFSHSKIELWFLIACYAHEKGDSMQPCHGVTLFSPSLPTGDQGGNLFFVLFADMRTNLHNLWVAALWACVAGVMGVVGSVVVVALVVLCFMLQ